MKENERFSYKKGKVNYESNRRVTKGHEWLDLQIFVTKGVNERSTNEWFGMVANGIEG